MKSQIFPINWFVNQQNIFQTSSSNLSSIIDNNSISDLKDSIQNQKYNFLLWVGGFDCQYFVAGRGRGMTACGRRTLVGRLTQKKLQSFGLHRFLFKPSTHASMSLGLNKKSG